MTKIIRSTLAWLKTPIGRLAAHTVLTAIAAGVLVLEGPNGLTAAGIKAAGLAIALTLLHQVYPIITKANAGQPPARSPSGATLTVSVNADTSGFDAALDRIKERPADLPRPAEFLGSYAGQAAVTSGAFAEAAAGRLSAVSRWSTTHRFATAETFTIERRHIHEHKVSGKPLGRHVYHDSRSLNHLVEADGTVASAKWTRHIPILDQGQVGSCTANAAVGVLGTDPDYAPLAALMAAGLKLNEALALVLYSLEEVGLGYGPYPPNDDGGSGLGIAKVLKAKGYIDSYKHITSIDAAKTAIQTGPFIVGSNWYTGMDNPNSGGLVTATGTVRGGHEYECDEFDADADLWWFPNSWGPGFGVAGRFCYSSPTFAQLLSQQGDATVLLPLKTPAPTPVPPLPASLVTITDPVVVAKMVELGKKAGISADDFTTDRLQSLYHLMS
jgi:hypothetical protein